jgi:hypothetical protein
MWWSRSTRQCGGADQRGNVAEPINAAMWWSRSTRELGGADLAGNPLEADQCGNLGESRSTQQTPAEPINAVTSAEADQRNNLCELASRTR